MSIKDTILTVANQKKRFTTVDVLSALKQSVSRQSINLILRSLLNEGILMKSGSTRGAFYFLSEYKDIFGLAFSRRLKNDGLEEHVVFNSMKEQSPFINNLKDQIFSIVQYAFDEMLNNAIDHSESSYIEINAGQEKKNITFTIKDFGIGVFKNVMQKRALHSELEAIQDLLKGKITTAPQAHSGEGIFFTSKAVDVFILESFGLRLRIDNIIDDIFVEEVKPSQPGTRVTCIISLDSHRHLSNVFRKYQSHDEDMAFDKTEVHIRLFTMGTIHVSRSQARRVLVGLDKFKTVILDFDRVPTVGQAFADEIFRVFKSKYPNIDIQPINMNNAVAFMVGRVGS